MPFSPSKETDLEGVNKNDAFLTWKARLSRSPPRRGAVTDGCEKSGLKGGLWNTFARAPPFDSNLTDLLGLRIWNFQPRGARECGILPPSSQSQRSGPSTVRTADQSWRQARGVRAKRLTPKHMAAVEPLVASLLLVVRPGGPSSVLVATL